MDKIIQSLLGIDARPKTRLPYLREMLYKPPSPGNARKSCGNCLLWIRSSQSCKIHDSDVTAPADGFCGYHVHGTPSAIADFELSNMHPIPPELSGLRQMRGGVSCDTCANYSTNGRRQGSCGASVDEERPDEPALVDSLGACARHEDR